MTRSLNSVAKKTSPARFNLDEVGVHMASYMIGRTVDMLVDAKTIAHGIVTGVLTESGLPKLVVGGKRYNLGQILTAIPSSLN